VSAAMDQRFVLLPRDTGPAAARAALVGTPRWVMVCDGPEPTAVLAARDLAGALSEGQAGPTLDLLETPGDPRPCAPI
jgi:hypothetical protein